MKPAFSLAAVALLIACPTAGWGQEVHANVRVQLGAADSNYPGCHGRMLAFLGASIEVGQPMFLELLGDMMGAGGDDCLPGRPSSGPGQPFTSAIIEAPNSRLGVGVGHRFADQHVSVVLRAGNFVNTREQFVASNVSVRLFAFTAGIELGKVKGRWQFEDGTTERRWSTFGGLSIGLRF